MSRHPFKPNASDDEGYEPFIVAEGWREETEIRFVPESEIAVAVAAAIEETRKQVYAEIRQLADEKNAYVVEWDPEFPFAPPEIVGPFADEIPGGETDGPQDALARVRELEDLAREIIGYFHFAQDPQPPLKPVAAHVVKRWLDLIGGGESGG